MTTSRSLVGRIVSYCIIPYCIISYCIVSYRIVSYRIILYPIVLYCFVLLGRREERSGAERAERRERSRAERAERAFFSWKPQTLTPDLHWVRPSVCLGLC